MNLGQKVLILHVYWDLVRQIRNCVTTPILILSSETLPGGLTAIIIMHRAGILSTDSSFIFWTTPPPFPNFFLTASEFFWTVSRMRDFFLFLCKSHGLAKSESIMGAILALSLYFQGMSCLCEWILQYQATLLNQRLWLWQSILVVYINCSVMLCSLVNLTNNICRSIKLRQFVIDKKEKHKGPWFFQDH